MSESDLTILRGDGTWPWSAHIDGNDIIVLNARATCFGGDSDPQDNGETASGVNTKANPTLKACALPRIYVGKNKALLKALGGSPIPSIPFQIKVEVTDPATGKTLTVPFIDIGPAKWTGNALDLTIAAARYFNPKATANRFELLCSYRIIGGAKYLKRKGSHS
jgi:hypothetical protein